MAAVSLQQRVAALETEVALLKKRIEATEKPGDPWLEKVWGAFANDPAFEEAMRLGREYRESLRPKRPQRRKR